MIFTREDILKILNALLQLGRKDSEFKDANTPLNSDDEIAILQDGINKKVSINNLLSTLGLLKKDDFINVSDRYDEYYIQLFEAITIIAKNKRKKGLVITFLDLQGNWKIFQFDGELNNFINTNYWKDLFDFKYPIVNSVLPDEEDLTLTLPNEDNNSFIKLKDKEYDTTNFSGMGTKIIRKNIIEVTLDDSTIKRINYLSQDVFNSENTIYVIKYDFTLNEDITIPANCVLKFDGGSLNEHKLISGGNTIIDGYGLKSEIDNTTADNFVFNQPTWVRGDTSGINADGSYNKPYKSLNKAAKHTNWIALSSKCTYTPGCDESFNSPLRMPHSLTLECLDGIATISGKVTILGTSSIVDGKNTVIISGIRDALFNVLNYSEETKELFNFGYISDGYSRYFRKRVVDINAVGDGEWSNAAAGGTSYSLPTMVVGEYGWYATTASIGCSCVCRSANNKVKLTIRNINIQDFGKHGIGLGNGSSIVAENCNFLNIGGSYQNIATKTPFGNAMEVYDGTHDSNKIIAKNCFFSNIFDAGVTIQGVDIASASLLISECTFKECTYGFEWFNGNPGNGTGANNCLFGHIRNNTFINCKPYNNRWYGKGFTIDGTPQETQCAIELWHNVEINLQVYDNIFVDSPIYGTKALNALPQTRNNRLEYSYSDAIILSPYYWPMGIILKVDNINTKTAVDVLNSGSNNSGNSILICSSNDYSGNSELTPVPNVSVSATNETGYNTDIIGSIKMHAGIKYTIKVVGFAATFLVKINNTWVDVSNAPLPFNQASWDFILDETAEGFKCSTTPGTKVTISNKETKIAPFIGQCYFNTEKGKPLWWNGSAWIDAAGATV